MHKNNTINEFELNYINGSYQLKSKELFNEEYQDLSHQWVWEFLTNKYTIKDISMECVWIFFITDNNKVKGFYKMNFITFNSLTGLEVLRIILMSGEKKVCFAIHFGNNENVFDYLHTITKVYQKKLDSLDITIIHSMLVSDTKYHLLDINE